jgi:hypothetical protein
MPYLVILLVDDPLTLKRELTSLDRKQSMTAVYPYPDHPTTCRGDCRARGKISGWGRKPDKGFMVHDCGKRHPDWRQRVTGALFDNLGRNLLRRPHHYFKNPETW